VGREAILAKRRGEKVAGEPGKRTPIRGTFFCCCASATTATASSIAAIRIDSTAAFFIAHLVRMAFITDTEAERSVIYGSGRTRFIEGKKANFDVGLN
jgi:hypothetical protein